MTQELILTSVSQGLEPNDQGFCPVAESGTVPPQLVMRLKSISSFKHLFPPESEDAAKNPIAYSHLIVPALDSTFHILSRIADSGVDYQHQPNRLAHHIVLGSEEQVPEGPAWILAQHAFHITQWLTPAVRFVQGRPLPTLTAPPPFSRLHQIDRERQRLDPERMRATVDSSIHGGSELPPLGNTPCPIWKQLTGDAGWGGVLAATIRTGRPVAILFEPGTNVLPLFVESLALLPPAMKWKATFSTYFSAYPEHVACQWKAVPVDSSEARQFRDDSTVLLIDLTTSLGKAMSGPYVEYARTGAEHSLPENEIQADLFEDAPEIFENLGVSAALNMPSPPPLSTSSPISEKAVGESFGSLSGGSDFPDVSSGSSKTSPPPISIQTSSDKSPGVVGSLLNMKSRGSFYAMFGATFLCVLFLSLIVADQLLGLGIFYQVPSKPGNTAAARQGANPPNGAPTERNVADGSKLNPTAIAAEQKRLADEQEKKAKESEQLEQQRKESVEQARKDYEKKLQAEKTELDRFLQEFPTLKPLSLRIPAPEDPARKQLFSEFTELYRWGAAIHFEFVPLLKNPRIRIETRKIPRFLGDPPDSEHELLVADDDSQANGTDAKTSKLEKLENSLPPDRSNLNVEDGERIPDPTRLEWSVLAVNTGTDYETPLLRLKLTPQGLSVDWSDAALSPQYYDDAALLRLGFLRFGVEGVKD